MNRPNITPGSFYKSVLLGSPGNYSIDIHARHEHDGGSTDKLVCCVESSRLPAQLEADAKALSALPELLAALESIIKQEHGDLSDARFRDYVCNQIAIPALTKAGYTF